MKEFNSLIIDHTARTPQVDLNQFTGELIISGKSIPENAAKVYEPVLEWIKQYILQPKPITNLRLNLEYFNTASSLWLSKILKVLKQISKPDFLLYIHLYLPVEEYDEMKELEDIKDAFFPITDIFQDAIPCIGLKLYGTNERSEIVKDALVFI
jgi:hypothetical protein